MVATVLAGGALAAAGQAALVHALPLTSDRANVLKLGVQELLGAPDLSDAVTVGAAPSGPAPVTSLAPIGATGVIGATTAEPRPVDVGGLVKAAELHRRAAAAAAQATPQAAPSTAERPAPSAAPDAPRPAPAAAADEVQMVSGQVTSGFGMRWGRLHRGLDIAAPVGTPIHAPMDGEVIASGPATGFGLWVRVRHDDGTVTTYGHVNRTLVRVGQHVAAGQEIAEVGNRGDSTGPHLHVEVETPGGATVNPRPWLDGHGIGY